MNQEIYTENELDDDDYDWEDYDKALKEIKSVPENFMVTDGGFAEGLSNSDYRLASRNCSDDYENGDVYEWWDNESGQICYGTGIIADYLPKKLGRIYTPSDIQAMGNLLEKNATLLLFSMIRDKKEAGLIFSKLGEILHNFIFPFVAKSSSVLEGTIYAGKTFIPALHFFPLFALRIVQISLCKEQEMGIFKEGFSPLNKHVYSLVHNLINKAADNKIKKHWNKEEQENFDNLLNELRPIVESDSFVDWCKSVDNYRHYRIWTSPMPKYEIDHNNRIIETGTVEPESKQTSKIHESTVPEIISPDIERIVETKQEQNNYLEHICTRDGHNFIKHSCICSGCGLRNHDEEWKGYGTGQGRVDIICRKCGALYEAFYDDTGTTIEKGEFW